VAPGGQDADEQKDQDDDQDDSHGFFSFPLFEYLLRLPFYSGARIKPPPRLQGGV